MVEFFDLDKVVEYTISLGNATTAAKVGFFLEKYRDTLMPNEDQLNRLQALIPAQPHYMVRNGRKPGRFVREWNLVVPLYPHSNGLVHAPDHTVAIHAPSSRS